MTSELAQIETVGHSKTLSFNHTGMQLFYEAADDLMVLIPPVD
ncbi:MAG: hypothetical protein OXE78_09845 [Gammaproteobacteria bacterium]|nr:hypothetical protein [Gammaproteobacteria bacterium]MCY4358156.1 hypothetical protein [Gammaproteobacteria bacterium]